MRSAFGVEHGEVAKSWSKNAGRASKALPKLLSQRNGDQRKIRYLSDRQYVASQGKPLEAHSPASRAKQEYKVLGEGRSVSEGGRASVGMALKPRKVTRKLP